MLPWKHLPDRLNHYVSHYEYIYTGIGLNVKCHRRCLLPIARVTPRVCDITTFPQPRMGLTSN